MRNFLYLIYKIFPNFLCIAQTLELFQFLRFKYPFFYHYPCGCDFEQTFVIVFIAGVLLEILTFK